MAALPLEEALKPEVEVLLPVVVEVDEEVVPVEVCAKDFLVLEREADELKPRLPLFTGEAMPVGLEMAGPAGCWEVSMVGWLGTAAGPEVTAWG